MSTANYAIKRVLMMIPVLIGVTLGVFLLLRLTPGDPVQAILPPGQQTPENIARVEERYALDQPLYAQYGRWALNVLQGDLGRSYVLQTPVSTLLLTRLWATAQLAFVALTVSLVIAIPFGILSGVYKNTWIDHVGRLIAFLGISIPAFYLGILIILFFALFWQGWFGDSLIPSGGYVSPREDLRGWFHHIIAPGITLGVGYSALTARLTRSSMVEVLNEEYIQTARAKGAKEQIVILTHGFRNALIPIVTVLGIHIGFLFNGSIVVEEVFQWPGIGRLLFQAVLNQDLPVIQGAILVIAFIFVLANLIVDLLYGYLDPRIDYE